MPCSLVEYSKRVGWEPRNIAYPSEAEIVEIKHKLLVGEVVGDEYATLTQKILEYYRFLPSPNSDEEVKVLTGVIYLFHYLFDQE